MLTSIVREIGPQALDAKDKMLILFDDKATDMLKQFSVIQKFNSDEPVDLTVGDKIMFDRQAYTIKHVGPVANEHLNSMGHVSLVFGKVPEEDLLANGLYLEPFELPVVNEGTVISYSQNGGK
ncbi:PTS glucitol/sorbitol transporter subunit IIA [Vagococcus acidifermentans]|uniref:PTS sorbitol transporter subunit IIA n=1 Tax=Vagococcus acidifermentans TaxID=564710 RepID=A0A430AVL0_9ENTE|nr:PTS glucitol/sorbitol transporter subunit IIA [Vagococcus acidifermentans]RSU12098.1 PTS sorbitol transporter subunit IIA [Vagococcus acidifermentans]